MGRFDDRLHEADPGFRELIERIPLQRGPALAPEWLRCEMLERYLVLQGAGIGAASTVLEVGSGAHAISTVPLAYLVGPDGRVLAAERRRWNQFRPVISASGLMDRVRPLACDARRLPLRDGAVALAACVHGIRSLQSEPEMVRIFREMLRVAPRIFLAESLPDAVTDAQRAHLAMYDLREEVFRATTGHPDDLHYLTLAKLRGLVEQAGGVVTQSRTMEIDLPHALAYFPRSLVEAMPAGAHREDLLRRWDEAADALDREGADHPPVGTIEAARP